MGADATHVPKGPVATGVFVYGLWQRLTPAQKRVLLEAARTHGPKVAAATVAAAAGTPEALTRRADQAAVHAEGGAHDPVLLELVRGRVALARRRPPRAPDVGDAGTLELERAASSSRCRIERQAPMFWGSSWAQTISSRCGRAAMTSATASTGNG